MVTSLSTLHVDCSHFTPECVRCSLVYKVIIAPTLNERQYKYQQAIQCLSSSVFPSTCFHTGPSAFFWALLFRLDRLITAFLNQDNKNIPPQYEYSMSDEKPFCGSYSFSYISLHPTFWPFPYFSTLDDVQKCLHWTKKRWKKKSVCCDILTVTDPMVLSWILPQQRRNLFHFLTVRWISQKKGFGLYTTVPLAKETFIGVYAGRMCSLSSIKKEPLASTHACAIPSAHLFFPYKKYFWIINALKEGSETRFLNHCPVTPSVGYKRALWRGVPLLLLYTTQQVTKGEELTINYGLS